MTGADIGLGWIDQKGQLHFQVNIEFLLLETLSVRFFRIDMHTIIHDQW